MAEIFRFPNKQPVPSSRGENPPIKKTEAQEKLSELRQKAEGTLRGLLEGAVGTMAQNAGAGNVEKSASGYNDVVSKYSDDEILEWLASASTFQNTKPAFYKALRDEAKLRHLAP